MSNRGLGAIIGFAAALSLLLAAQPAVAATQVGNSCVGDSPGPGIGVVSLTNGPGNPFPATMPSGGVVTRWTSSLSSEIPPGVLIGSLKILRPTGAPKQFQVVGESSGVLGGGPNTFPARIPVQAGDHIGIVGKLTTEPATIISVACNTENPGDSIAIVGGDPPVGTTVVTGGEGPGAQVPIVATLEPDVDNDGFGDESQDLCPQSPLAQGICPTVAVEASHVQKRKGSVVVLVTTDAAAPVNVTGTANLGKKKKSKFRSKTQTVVPGKVTRFTLNFPKKLKNKLRGLVRKRSLQLRVTASATDTVGRVTSDTLKTKLKGQKKPRR